MVQPGMEERRVDGLHRVAAELAALLGLARRSGEVITFNFLFF